MPLSEHFEGFADWCVDTSPLYERLSRGVAADPELLALAREIPDGKSPTHLLFASVHDLLLGGASHPLRRFYPSVVADAVDPDEVDPVPHFRDFALENADALRERFRTRRTQTNCVRRSAALLPAFEHVARQVGRRPLALVEVGPSAGLNLCWDRYRYDYDPAGQVGPAETPVTVDSELRGDVQPPLPAGDFPPVASRVGLDLNPLDVTDSADVRWLRALVWPEHTDRHELLDGAVAAAQTDPPEIRTGDAVDDLPAVVTELADDVPIVVYDTQVQYQLSEAGRERYRETVHSLGRERERELHWLSGDEGVPDEEAIWLDHTVVRGSETETTRLAAYQQHGRWVRWEAG